jgi:hypothetical protein
VLSMGSRHTELPTTCWAPMAHTYNPSYSGGRDQEGGWQFEANPGK